MVGWFGLVGGFVVCRRASGRRRAWDRVLLKRLRQGLEDKEVFAPGVQYADAGADCPRLVAVMGLDSTSELGDDARYCSTVQDI